MLVREPGAGNRHAGFDEREVETELWRGYSGTARRKRRQQTTQTYGHRATSRLYLLPGHDSKAPIRAVPHLLGAYRNDDENASVTKDTIGPAR